MSRPLNKKELIQFSENEFEILLKLIDSLSESQRDKDFVFENRTPKDIIAHLYAWQILEIGWYEEGMKGRKPAIPALGYTFKDTPTLNEKLFQDYKDITWKKLIVEFRNSHSKLIQIIAGHSEAELFEKKKYDWTGSTSMAIYFRSALSSHYLWANTLLKKFIKKKASHLS